MEMIYCAAGNRRFPEIAMKYGFLYGAQLPNTIYHAPYFVDQDWHNPNREKYMAALAQWRPALASVLDWEHEEQRAEVFAWAEEAAQYVSEAVIIIPKVIGSIPQIPETIGGKKVRLGYPTVLKKTGAPSKFAGKPVPTWEYERREVHLLGGSPQTQLKVSRYLNVASVDGNYAQGRATQHVQYFANGVARHTKNRYFPKLNESKLGFIDHDAPYVAFEMSCFNIAAMWKGFPASLRYAVEDDLKDIIKIHRQASKELGAPHYPALRAAMQRREVVVAEFGQQIVGFVHFHCRRDGWQTIYEIAVAQNWRGQKIGTGLLCAVPAPVRLKCTTDNIANAFYEAEGFCFAHRDAGKQRALNVWEKRVA